MERNLIVPSRVDTDTFLQFGVFDTFRLQKRWRRPALFAAILCGCGAACLASGREGGTLLGGVLLAVGLGLPLIYVANFLFSLRRQAGRLQLDGKRIVYTLHLQPEGVSVSTGKENTAFPWAQIHRAYRVPGCIYLYAAPRRAFLLPENGQEESVWQALTEHLPPEKLEDRRRKE